MSAMRDFTVKLCGIRTPSEALAARCAGADLIGMVFAPGRRGVSPGEAIDIVTAVRAAGGRIPRIVGVFVDETSQVIEDTVCQVGLDVVQLSGQAAPDLANMPHLTVARTVHVSVNDSDLRERVEQALARFDMVILDSGGGTRPGGTGETFDWQRAVNLGELRHRVILAGGLTPDNVAEAIDMVAPAGVDVSSGIEHDGVKAPALMDAFVSAARDAARRIGGA